MMQDWSDSANNDNDMRKTVNKAKLSSRIVNWIFILHVINVIAYSINVFTTDVDINDREADLPLLVNVLLPIDITTMRTYRLMVMLQFVNIMMIACGAGLMNALLLTLVRFRRRSEHLLQIERLLRDHGNTMSNAYDFALFRRCPKRGNYQTTSDDSKRTTGLLYL